MLLSFLLPLWEEVPAGRMRGGPQERPLIRRSAPPCPARGEGRKRSEPPMRIVFMGTPEFAVPTLQEIVSAGHDVVAVYTRAPKPAGRGQAERRSPVHEAAVALGIP